MSAKKSVPELRFKGFSGEWEEQQLKEVVEFIGTGKSTFNLSTKKVGNKLYPVLGSRAVIGYDSKYDYLGNFILTARVGENAGKLYTYSGKVKISDNTVYIKTENLDYFYYFLTKFDLSKLAFGTGQPLIKSSELSNLKLFLPNKQEQTKIGNYFQNLDKLIEQKEKKYQKLGQLKKAMLEKMFSKEGATTPEIRFKGCSGEWEEERLGELSEYKNGKGHEDKQKTSGQYELINLNSISINGGLKHSGKFIDETDITLNKNDLVMILSDVGHGDLLGRVALIPENNRFVLNQRVALLRPQKNIIPLFLFYNINAHQKYFKLQGAGMSQLNISRSSVEDFISYFPLNLHEQTKIGNYFQKLDHLIELQNQELQKLKNIKKASLAKMFV